MQKKDWFAEIRAACVKIIDTMDVKIIPLYFYVTYYCISFINKHVKIAFLCSR
jgi:hypothetical protein